MIVKTRTAWTVFLLMAAGAHAADLSSNDLIEQAKQLHGKEVVYTGEAIGDPMRRGGHCWVNVNDGNNAIGIWLDERQFAVIRTFGSYDATGDVLRIRGTFHRSCPEHGGDMDIHAAAIDLVKGGEALQHPVRVLSLVLAAIFLPASLAVFLLWRKKEKS
jgi:hypothetical protein